MQIINKLFELVFPKRKTYELIVKLPPKSLCAHYNRQSYNGFIFLASYSIPTVQAAIREAKFHKNDQAAKLLAELLKVYFKEKLSDQDYWLIPIPLSAKRQKKRGFNQVTKILKLAIVDYPNLKLRTDLLERTKDTKPQTKLSREERLKNLSGAFSTKRSADLTGANIIIIDDVTTTGATLREARAPLAPLNPASITCLVLAH